MNGRKAKQARRLLKTLFPNDLFGEEREPHATNINHKVMNQTWTGRLNPDGTKEMAGGFHYTTYTYISPARQMRKWAKRQVTAGVQ